ncbi:MAG: hypothetical protein KKH28_10555 [Elusimicrobia bacterium]|nr:hypothetical protein [Elusimicrobiota bacterium]
MKRPILNVPPALGYRFCRAVGLLVQDVVITRQEIQGLMEGRLCVDAPAPGKTKLTGWLSLHKATPGRRYTSELARRTDRLSAYQSN